MVASVMLHTPAVEPSVGAWMRMKKVDRRTRPKEPMAPKAAPATTLISRSAIPGLRMRLLQRLGPSRAVTVTFLVPAFGVLYGTTFLGEPLTLWMLLCGVVVVLGTALSAGGLKLPGRKM